MPARSPFTAVTTFVAGLVVLTARVVVGGVGTLVGAAGSATEPIHGTGPSEVAGSNITSDADALSPLPAAINTAAMTTPTTTIASTTKRGPRFRPLPAGGG